MTDANEFLGSLERDARYAVERAQRAYTRAQEELAERRRALDKASAHLEMVQKLGVQE